MHFTNGLHSGDLESKIRRFGLPHSCVSIAPQPSHPNAGFGIEYQAFWFAPLLCQLRSNHHIPLQDSESNIRRFGLPHSCANCGATNTSHCRIRNRISGVLVCPTLVCQLRGNHHIPTQDSESNIRRFGLPHSCANCAATITSHCRIRNRISDAHSKTHTHTHTNRFTPSQTRPARPHTHNQTHTHPDAPSKTNTHTHTHTQSQTLTQPNAHSKTNTHTARLSGCVCVCRAGCVLLRAAGCM